MCGILFHAYARQPASDDAYTKALYHMRQRGPDHESFESADGFVIGHTRLAIIDTSDAGHQPYWDREGRFVMSYNGEIYNHRELRKELEARGISFTTRCDTEVLLNAILAWGVEATLPRLRGMFAFVLHDTLKCETIAARDHFGQKPLYYHHGSGGLVVASDPLSITEITGERMPDHDCFTLYLATGGETGTRGMHHPEKSFFAGVSVLPAGKILRYRSGRLSISQYFAPWELFDPDAYQRACDRSEEDLLDELLVLAAQSVRRHLVADVPIGVLLSGGIDSSMLFWLAIAQNSDLQTFTKLSPGIETIPLDVVPKLLQRRSATAHFITQDKSSFVGDLEQFITYARSPSRWNSGPSMASLCRSARQNGAIALMGGDCADEIFGGYIHYKAYFNRCPGLDDLGDLVGLQTGKPAPEIVESYLTAQHEIRGAILSRVAGICDDRERQAQATLLHDQCTFLQTCVLPHSDTYSMMASVELRNPMLDLDFAAFAANLPMQHKAAHHVNGEFGKRLFRALAEREVGEFINVRKEGTRNYAMAMAEVRYWHVSKFEMANAFGVEENLTKRQLIRLINLELFNNAFFSTRPKHLDELMTKEGLATFNVQMGASDVADGSIDQSAA